MIINPYKYKTSKESSLEVLSELPVQSSWDEVLSSIIEAQFKKISEYNNNVLKVRDAGERSKLLIQIWISLIILGLISYAIFRGDNEVDYILIVIAEYVLFFFILTIPGLLITKFLATISDSGSLKISRYRDSFFAMADVRHSCKRGISEKSPKKYFDGIQATSLYLIILALTVYFFSRLNIFITISVFLFGLIILRTVEDSLPPSLLLLGHVDEKGLENYAKLKARFVNMPLVSCLAIGEQSGNILGGVITEGKRFQSLDKVSWEKNTSKLLLVAERILVDARYLTPTFLCLLKKTFSNNVEKSLFFLVPSDEKDRFIKYLDREEGLRFSFIQCIDEEKCHNCLCIKGREISVIECWIRNSYG